MSLINKLPSFYDNDITKPIQNSFTVETSSINDEVENTLNQFYIDSATYGLDKWEKMLGISKNNNDIQTRRENIKAKMRSRGTITKRVLEIVASSFSNGKVDLVENYNDYSITIFFNTNIGRQLDVKNLNNAIAEIIPAHLAFDIILESPNVISIKTKFSAFGNAYLECGTTDCFKNQYNLVGDYL